MSDPVLDRYQLDRMPFGPDIPVNQLAYVDAR